MDRIEVCRSHAVSALKIFKTLPSIALDVGAYGLVAKPSSQPAPSLGGNRVVQQAPIHTTSRYAAMTRQHHAITSKKGWPKEAVQDWEAWGHRDPIRFFRLWPELSGPGFSPGI